MRIDYRLGLGSKKQTLSDFELISEGREIAQTANNDSSVIPYIISRNAVVDRTVEYTERLGHRKWTSGDSEYSSATLDLAKDFANYIGDSRFLKFLLKYEKYNRDLYETRYKEQETAYDAYKDNEYYSKRQEEKLKEIKTIESDFNLSNTEKKKKIVIKRKELKEIQIQANKYKKSFLNKYVNLRKKSNKHAVRAFNFDLPEKYFTILLNIKNELDCVLKEAEVKPYDPNFRNTKKYYNVSRNIDDIEIPLVIDEISKKQFFDKLIEQYYPNKTNSGKIL